MSFPWKFVVFGVILNTIFVLCVIAPIYVIKHFAKPQARGFDPADSSIALSVESNTVSSTMGVTGSAFVTAVSILIVEVGIALWRQRKLSLFKAGAMRNESLNMINNSHTKCSSSTGNNKTTSKQIWLAAAQTFWLVLVLQFIATGITGTVTNLGKYAVARPRPNFLHSCRPDYLALNKTACNPCGSAEAPGPHWPLCPGCPFVSGEVAMKNVCKIAPNNHKPVDMWLSFPSGHSSYSMCAGVFLAVYFHVRLRESYLISQHLIALHPLAIFASLLFGIITSLSRVFDHKHHLTDVLSGAALGSFIGFMIATTLVLPILQKIPKKFAELASYSDNDKEKQLSSFSPTSEKTPLFECSHTVIINNSRPIV